MTVQFHQLPLMSTKDSTKGKSKLAVWYKSALVSDKRKKGPLSPEQGGRPTDSAVTGLPKEAKLAVAAPASARPQLQTRYVAQ